MGGHSDDCSQRGGQQLFFGRELVCGLVGEQLVYGNPDESVKSIPDQVDRGNLVSEELNGKQGNGRGDHRPSCKDVQSRGKWEVSYARQQAQGGHSGIEVQARGKGDCGHRGEQFVRRDLRQVEHWSLEANDSASGEMERVLDRVESELCRFQGVAEWRSEKRKFRTITRDLREMATWLASPRVEAIAMEATGVYWKPVWNILEAENKFHLLLVNAHHVKQVPGRKTDQKDSQWIADLLQHGLLKASFVPPQTIRCLRDLTRMRVKIRQMLATFANRIQKGLEDANIKLGSVASDVLGVSGRHKLHALVEGQQDPNSWQHWRRADCGRSVPSCSWPWRVISRITIVSN